PSQRDNMCVLETDDYIDFYNVGDRIAMPGADHWTQCYEDNDGEGNAGWDEGGLIDHPIPEPQTPRSQSTSNGGGNSAPGGGGAHGSGPAPGGGGIRPGGGAPSGGGARTGGGAHGGGRGTRQQ